MASLRPEPLDGTIYSHPVGLHGHAAGPLIGMWDLQDGVPGRGDAKVTPRMWFAVELQATRAVPEWNRQRLRSGQEEDAVVDERGVARWAYRRQAAYHLVR